MRALVGVGLLAMSLAAQAATPVEVVESFHKAMASGVRADVESKLDPAAVIFETGYVESSRAEYADHHLAQDMAYAKSSSVEVLKRTLREEGNWAIVLSETKTTDRSGKAPVVYAGTETMVLKRSGDAWLISHVHWSSHKLKP